MPCLSVSLLHTFVPVMMSNNNSITSCTLTVGCFLTFVLEPPRHQKRQHPAFNQSASESHNLMSPKWSFCDQSLTATAFNLHSVSKQICCVRFKCTHPQYRLMAMFSCSVISNTVFDRAVVLKICIKAFRVQTPACAVTLSSCWPMSPPTSHSLKSLSAVMDTRCSSR